MVNRPPEKAPWSRSWSPNSTTVPGLPRKPTSTAPVAGLTNVPVVNSAGMWSFLTHHNRYSARAQTRPGGPQVVQQVLQSPVMPHGGAQPFGPHAPLPMTVGGAAALAGAVVIPGAGALTIPVVVIAMPPWAAMPAGVPPVIPVIVPPCTPWDIMPDMAPCGGAAGGAWTAPVWSTLLSGGW